MNLFEQNDYRSIILIFLESQGTESRGQKSRIAESLNMHSSHLSQILSGTRSLTPDQALSLAKHMGLTELETEYFLQLVYLERAATVEFRKYTEGKIKEIRTKSLKASDRFSHQKQLKEADKAQFYSHYLYSAVRLYCSTHSKGRSFDEIRNRFDLSRDRLLAIVEFLIRTGLITEDRGQHHLGIASTFIARDSAHIHRHHANWRLLAIQNSHRLEEDEMMFTAPMSISKKDFLEIKDELLKYISKLSPKITESPAEDIACLNVDFFWIKK